jgi:hypothetical protein
VIDGNAATVLDEPVWMARADAHRARADGFTDPHRQRAGRGESHPVWDFLFTYYSLRPRQLRVWHPGYGVTLTGPKALPYVERTGYVRTDDGVTIGQEHLRSRLGTVRFVADLMRATAARPPRFGCFGMHEWAMVYRSEEPRHGALPLRLGPAGTNAVVDSNPLRCSHFDAFRFFTAAAAPRNMAMLTREDQLRSEQPGCVHANMDLYKWCYKLGPLSDSELLMDCLDLAAHAREIDMRASPYDLAEYGFEPIRVDESAGRAEYVREQTAIAERAAPLREALLHRCEQLLAWTEWVLPAGKINGFS